MAESDSQTTDNEDWITIRELLKAGCSLPATLQKKHDTHMREVMAALVPRNAQSTAGEWGRSIFESAKASVDSPLFGDAWRNYVANSGFAVLSEHDCALIRIAFVAGWRAREIS